MLRGIALAIAGRGLDASDGLVQTGHQYTTGRSGMSSGFYGSEGFGSSPFDDFLARIYGASGGAPRPQRVDITRLMSARARELLGAAAAKAAELGGTDLDSVHLLWAAA